MRSIKTLCPLALIAAVGCASTGPTPELMDARRAYDQARTSEASTYSPDKLLSAKQALERAEAAHEDDPGSFKERSLAYVAERRAQYANVYGQYEKDQHAQAEARQAYREKQDRLRRNAERQASQAQRSLAATWDNLADARRRLEEQESQIQKSQAQLEAEKQARAEAERKADAAVASLSKIAQVKEEQRGVVITLDGQVLFVTGKAELLPIARERLDSVAKSLNDLDGDKLVTIEGYTDSRGSDDMNMKLSQDRADAVKEYLVSRGVNANKLRAVGRGETHPVASNDTPEGRANNRRVEIVIQSSSQAAESLSKEKSQNQNQAQPQSK